MKYFKIFTMKIYIPKVIEENAYLRNYTTQQQETHKIWL